MDVLKRNNVKVAGRGEVAMIFAHGYGCDQNMWRFVAPAFERDYRVVLFDHVGSGQADPAAFNRSKYSSLNGYARDLLEICATLDLRRAVFVGHSVSSMIGVLAAIKEPDRFSALVLIGPSPCYINDGEYRGGFDRKDIDSLLEALESNYLGWSNTMAPVIMGNAERPELAGELAESFCRNDPEMARVFARATFLSDNRADLARLRTPSLILQCSQDVIAPESVGQFLATALPQSELVQLRATGHCPNLSAPEETLQAMRGFLSKATDSGARVNGRA